MDKKLFLSCSLFCISFACFPQLPSALFSIGNNHLCPGTCTGFTNLSSNATSYQWFFSGGTPSTDTAFDPSLICYSSPGSYDVTLIAINSFGSDTMVMPNLIVIYPYPPPIILTESNGTLYANTGYMAYQWYLNGVAIAGASDNYYLIPNNPGDVISLVAVDSNGCEVQSSDWWTAVLPHEQAEDIAAIHPNPVSEQLSVKCSQLSGAPDNCSVYNLLGEKIMEVSFPSSRNKDPIILDVQQLSPGLYSLEITSSEKISRIKFIKN